MKKSTEYSPAAMRQQRAAAKLALPPSALCCRSLLFKCSRRVVEGRNAASCAGLAGLAALGCWPGLGSSSRSCVHTAIWGRHRAGGSERWADGLLSSGGELCAGYAPGCPFLVKRNVWTVLGAANREHGTHVACLQAFTPIITMVALFVARLETPTRRLVRTPAPFPLSFFSRYRGA